MNRKPSNKCNRKFKQLLKATLKARGMTMTDLAKNLGVSYIYLASLSNGSRRLSGLMLDKQRLLAEFLGISMVELFLLIGVLRKKDLARP